MDNREKLAWRIWSHRDMGKSLLIGGLVFYVPLVNLLLLGYYGRWLQQLVRREGLELPGWGDGRALLEELARVLLPVLFWGFLPFLLASLLTWAVAGLLSLLHLGFFAATLAFLPLALASVLAPLLVTASLIRLYQLEDLREAFQVTEVLRQVIRRLKPAFFPILRYHGLLVIGWPLLGFVSFLAVLLLLAELVLVFRDEQGT